jgi:rare lipoprotein A
MNHKLFSGLTASLLITTLGVLPSYANSTDPVNQGADTSSKPVNSNAAPSDGKAAEKTPIADNLARVNQPTTEAVKIGEQKSEPVPSRGAVPSSPVIAKVQIHMLAGRKSAILYVRNLPILTFTGSATADSGTVKVGVQNKPNTDQPDFRDKSIGSNSSPENPSIHSLLNFSKSFAESDSDSLTTATLDVDSVSVDPVWRATVLAARINHLFRTGLDAKTISLRWDNQQKSGTGDRLLLQAGQMTIAVLDRSTASPDSSRNLEQDALQATNRLRRLLGNAEPLQTVAGRPIWGTQNLALGSIQARFVGYASWYGPGLHGNYAASGERFNQYAMTFGTRVMVTNLDNGQSVVVRINDRGPFHGNRIIDLSTASAQVIGVVQSGVARVRLEVMGPNSVATNGN